MYFRCPSAKMVSKARELFPDPDTPVMTTRRSRVIDRSISRRLCSRAPVTRIAGWRGLGIVLRAILGLLGGDLLKSVDEYQVRDQEECCFFGVGRFQRTKLVE